MSNQVTPEVVGAFLDESVRVTRRIEIYESDGETLWMDSSETPRAIDGAITVDYTRDERRAFDLTLDNSDQILNHDPNGFWYDKVIKAYRGIEYRNTRKMPRIAVIRDSVPVGRLSVIGFLREMGYVDITDLTATPVTADALAGYDIVVANSGAHFLTADESAILKQLYVSGNANIFTLGNDNQAAQIPFLTTSYTKTGSEVWQVNKVQGDTPFAYGWNSYTSVGDTDNGWIATGLVPTARAAAYWTIGATTVYPATYDTNKSGSRWFNYQPTLMNSPVRTQVRRFFAQIISWLHNYDEVKSFESQVGEFVIDRISGDNFPSHIKVTGRDYTKRLLTDKFERSVTFSAGTPVDTLVGAIAANSGIFKTLLDSDGAILASDVTFDRESIRWGAVRQVTEANGVECYFNPEGYLTTRPFIDPTTAPTAIVLKTGKPDGNLVSYTKSSSDAQVYNVISVVSENQDDLADGIAYFALAENNDPSSPTRIEKLGRRVYPYTSAFLESQEAADRLALQLLKIHALEEFQLDFSSIAYPWLDVGVVAGFVDPKPGVGEPDRFLLTNLNIPFSLGPMSGTGKRITIIGGE